MLSKGCWYRGFRHMTESDLLLFLFVCVLMLRQYSPEFVLFLDTLDFRVSNIPRYFYFTYIRHTCSGSSAFEQKDTIHNKPVPFHPCCMKKNI